MYDRKLFMPAPYAEPGSLWSRAVSRLGAFGQGAAPSQQYTGSSNHTNPHDITLTGSDQLIAASAIAIQETDFVMVSVMLNGSIDNNLSGDLHSTVFFSGGVTNPVDEVINSFGAGNFALQNYYFSFQPGIAGVLTVTLQAHTSGDATVTIPAKKGQLLVQRISGNR